MALPPITAVPYAYLGNVDGTVPRADGSILSDFHDNGSPLPPLQKSFYSYQLLYPNYPDEILVKAWDNNLSPARLYISFASMFDGYTTWVDNVTIVYNPPPCGSDAVPNPNGIAMDFTPTPTAFVGSVGQRYPRWTTDDPYDFSAAGTGPTSFPPLGGTLIGSTDFFGSANWSFEFSIPSPEVDVLNDCTGLIENYPMAQPFLKIEANAKIKIMQEVDRYCCWNTGTVLKGKVGLKSVDGTATALSLDEGLSIALGASYADAGTVDWEITIEDGFVVPEIIIPRTLGKITFVNDFWITEVTPPAP
jgi:hypothetical protein